MEENEYERLRGAGVIGSMVAGAVAGTSEHLVMYPVDSVKTRMQALKCEKRLAKGVFNNVVYMVKNEGALRPLRGASVVMVGSGPAHALYFTTYEQTKKLFKHKKLSSIPDNVGIGIAGVGATICHDAVMTPAEVVKQRMQMCCSKHSRWTTCARSIYREEGFRAFFRSFTTQLAMNIPFQVCQFIVYENFKRILNPRGEYDPKSHLVAGGLAGGIAAAATNPLDVCKTLLNTQEPQLLRELKTARVVGLRNAWRTVQSVAGRGGFYKGLSARIMFQAPATGICWLTYETLNHLLSWEESPEEKYDTLATIAPQPTPPAASTGTTKSTEKGEGRLWDTITDLPRPLKALDVWSENETPLKYSDGKFPNIRTE